MNHFICFVEFFLLVTETAVRRGNNMQKFISFVDAIRELKTDRALRVDRVGFISLLFSTRFVETPSVHLLRSNERENECTYVCFDRSNRVVGDILRENVRNEKSISSSLSSINGQTIILLSILGTFDHRRNVET